MKMKLIGKGMFSNVYREGSSKTVVIHSSDPAKEALSFNWHRNASGVFPKTERADFGVYKMEYFPRVSLKSSLRPDQYALYKELRKTFDRLGGNMEYRRYNHTKYAALYCEMNNSEIPNKVKNDILSYIDSLANYGSDICFEISPRNVAVKNGRLILLDCFFFKSELEKVRPIQ
jgi:hypothetical protein